MLQNSFIFILLAKNEILQLRFCSSCEVVHHLINEIDFVVIWLQSLWTTLKLTLRSQRHIRLFEPSSAIFSYRTQYQLFISNCSAQFNRFLCYKRKRFGRIPSILGKKHVAIHRWRFYVMLVAVED